MSEHTIPAERGEVTFTLPEGTKITAPRALAETLGWTPDQGTPPRRRKQ